MFTRKYLIVGAVMLSLLAYPMPSKAGCKSDCKDTYDSEKEDCQSQYDEPDDADDLQSCIDDAKSTYDGCVDDCEN